MSVNRHLGHPLCAAKVLLECVRVKPQGQEPAFPTVTAALCPSAILVQPASHTARNSLSRGSGSQSILLPLSLEPLHRNINLPSH